jgi:hypothetical protein
MEREAFCRELEFSAASMRASSMVSASSTAKPAVIADPENTAAKAIRIINRLILNIFSLM